MQTSSWLDPRERAWVEVDEAALALNTRQICSLLRPDTDLMAVIKADAYGHGAVTVAQTVLEQGATCLGVATLSEAIQLRRAGQTAPIILLGAVTMPEQVQALAYWRVEPTVSDPAQAQMIAAALDEGVELPVHLDLDTGMGRLGVPWQEAAAFVHQIRGVQALRIASVYSHLATADSPDPAGRHLQHQRFEAALRSLAAMGYYPPCRHLANSAGTLVDSALHYDRVRVGLALYGYAPAPHLADCVTLRPVLQVRARITQIKRLPAGAGVSYGHHFVAGRPTRIATVAIGYGDGVPRALSNQLMVLIAGQRARQVGAITMDHLMVDVTDLPQVQVGDVVTLLGRDGRETLSPQDWATPLGTIVWEILCGFRHRLPRVTVPVTTSATPVS
ncbi:MAG: alanine racemase [Gloeomargaritaceae cyanobacterium C42_A2020_066]|nr:alanine racemase [Gloeomargaritaceae cyanobacterium C42_A2020_066]